MNYDDQQLQHLTFSDIDTLIKWANSPDGTDYIISIVFQNEDWHLFYVK